jgi:hypothetical protein
MKPNPNLPPEHQQMQAELYGRIDAEHRKERDAKLLFRLKIILFAAVVLISCIGISKCQAEHNSQPQNTTIKCRN